MKYAVVCVYNNEQQFKAMKNSALLSNRMEGLIYGIDNQNNQFTSAAKAYNYAIRELFGYDVLIFCHQDVRFYGNSLQVICEAAYCNKNTLYGIAGTTNGGMHRHIVSTIKDPWRQYNSLKKQSQNVFSLDECLIAGNSLIFTEGFNETICDGWHLYALELCLRMHICKNPIRVLKVDMEHLSGGVVDECYYRCFEKIRKEYGHIFPIITAPSGYIYCNNLIYEIHKIIDFIICHLSLVH